MALKADDDQACILQVSVEFHYQFLLDVRGHEK